MHGKSLSLLLFPLCLASPTILRIICITVIKSILLLNCLLNLFHILNIIKSNEIVENIFSLKATALIKPAWIKAFETLLIYFSRLWSTASRRICVSLSDNPCHNKVTADSWLEFSFAVGKRGRISHSGSCHPSLQGKTLIERRVIMNGQKMHTLLQLHKWMSALNSLAFLPQANQSQ